MAVKLKAARSFSRFGLPLFAAASLALSGASFAQSVCDADLSAVEGALASASDTDKAAIMPLVAEAKDKKSAGDEDGCVATLAPAKQALNLK